MSREDNYDRESLENHPNDFICPGCDEPIDPSEVCWECDCCQDCCECIQEFWEED